MTHGCMKTTELVIRSQGGSKVDKNVMILGRLERSVNLPNRALS